MHVWIRFIFVIFNLQGGGKTLLTEGLLIASTAADRKFWNQFQLIELDGFVH